MYLNVHNRLLNYGAARILNYSLAWGNFQTDQALALGSTVLSQSPGNLNWAGLTA
jgi:hypothetical protein